jgi:hypothetical protein
MLRTPLTLSLAVLLLSVPPVAYSYAQDEAEQVEQDAPQAQEDIVSEDDAGVEEPKGEDVTESNITQSEVGQESPEELPPLRQPSDAVKKLNKSVADITLPLDGAKRAHFFMMYNNHNLISTVKRVKGDVSNAIDSCSAEHSDMEKSLRGRFSEWETAVDEQLDAAQANVENMIIAQDYTEEKEVRAIMKQADDLREETMMQTERIPVTTKEACEYLLNKMDETQANLVTLLKSTLVTLPKAMEKSNITPEDLEDQPEETVKDGAEEGQGDDAGEEVVQVEPDAENAAPETEAAPAE